MQCGAGDGQLKELLRVLWRKKFPGSSFYKEAVRETAEESESEYFILWAAVLLVVLAQLPVQSVVADDGSATSREKVFFNIPQQRADTALVQFAEQADVTFMFPFEEARQKTSNRLIGKFRIDEAIRILLKGTGLYADIQGDNVLSVHSSNKEKGGEMNTKKIDKRTGFFAGLIALLTLHGNAAMGQSGSTQAGPLEEVVVTAQFRKESLQDTPLAITALSDEGLEARNITDLAEATKFVPNVQITPGAQGFGQNASVFIRGLGQNDPHFALEPGVGIYIDDVYYGVLTGSAMDLMDIERIEVLRGPQGTLSGRNSIGGSVKIYTKDPGPEPEAYLEAGYGSYNKLKFRGASNFTLVEDKLYLRAFMGTIQKDGYLTQLDYTCATGDLLNLGPGLSGVQRQTGVNSVSGRSQRDIKNECKIGEEGGKSVWTGRVTLRWDINEDMDNVLKFDITEDDSQNPAGKLLLQDSLWTGGADFITGSESYTNYETNLSRPTGANPSLDPFRMPKDSPLESWGVSNRFHMDITDSLRIESITGYREVKTTFSQQLDASPASIWDQLWTLSQEQFTQELRVSGEYGTLVDWTIGGFYYTADGFSEGRINLPGSFAPGGGGINLEFLLNDPVDTESTAGFAHFAIHPVDKLTLIGGVRYSHDKKDFTFNRLDVLGNPHPLLGALLDVTGEFRDTRVDYRVGIDYKWLDNFMTYAQVATGYKGGGVNPRPFFVSQVVPFGPEEVTTYEGGFKGDFFNNRLRLNVAGFYSDFTNVQLNVTSCDDISPFPGAPCAATRNVGDAEITGFEVETVFRVSDGLMLDASYGLSDFEYTRIGPNVPVTKDMKNVLSPKHTVAIGGQYEHAFSNGHSIMGRIDFTYRSEMYAEATNAVTNRISDLALVNLSLRWTDPSKKWQVKGTVTNLFDRFYYVSKFDRANLGSNAILGQPGAPREWFISLKRMF